MKQSKTILGILAMFISAAVLGGIVFATANHFLTRDPASTSCKTTGIHRILTIQNDSFSNKQITARLCDTLTIINNDDKIRNIAFGAHDKHEPYDGVTERVLKKGGSLSVTLNKTGTYEVHDHLEDDTHAFFTVTN